MLINTKDYTSRVDLEKYIATLSGLTPEVKLHEIKGTVADLARFQLSEDTLFWGIKCIAIDPIAKQAPVEKPSRGEAYINGINLPADKVRKIK